MQGILIRFDQHLLHELLVRSEFHVFKVNFAVNSNPHFRTSSSISFQHYQKAPLSVMSEIRMGNSGKGCGKYSKVE